MSYSGQQTIVVTMINPGLPRPLSTHLCCSGTNYTILSLSKSVAPPTQKNALLVDTVTEHVFPDKPQTAIAHLLGSGATTRYSVQGVLVANTVLIFLDMSLNSLITML